LYQGERLNDMVQSIKELGVLLPIIVRKVVSITEEKYEILSGHNRVNAAKVAGLQKVPAIIKENLSDDEALLIVTETNLMQRSFSDLSISEKAKSLKVHYDALSNQGMRTDILEQIKKHLNTDDFNDNSTSCQFGTKLRTDEKLGEKYNLSRRSVARFIKINELNSELLEQVDEGDIPFVAGVELAFLKESEQKDLFEIMVEEEYKIDLKKSKALKEASQNSNLTPDRIRLILSGELDKKKKKGDVSIKIKEETIQTYFKGKNNKEIQETIAKAIVKYFEGVEL
jgi:ParB family chromosome partitioning protein